MHTMCSGFILGQITISDCSGNIEAVMNGEALPLRFSILEDEAGAYEEQFFKYLMMSFYMQIDRHRFIIRSFYSKQYM